MASFRRSPIGSISAITQWLYSTDHQPGVNHIFSTRLFNLISNPDLTPFFSHYIFPCPAKGGVAEPQAWIRDDGQSWRPPREMFEGSLTARFAMA